MPALNWLANSRFDDRNNYSDKVHFVHVYVTEPHPADPDLSPYSGNPEPDVDFVRRQEHTYAERVASAAPVPGWIQGNQLLLIDDLAPRQENNPAWCTYGPCPNCAYLIDQKGKVRGNQYWFDGYAMKQLIDGIF